MIRVTATCAYYVMVEGREGYYFPDEIGLVTADVVNHPAHYVSHPSGVECIEITEHLNFCLGNAIKYLWRADSKGDPIENLRKAAFYIDP